MLLQTARCPEYLQKVEVDYQLDSKVGLAHFFLFDCPSVIGLKPTVPQRVIKGKTRHPTYETNVKGIIAFRECGVWYDGIKLFLRCCKHTTTNEQNCLSKIIKINS